VAGTGFWLARNKKIPCDSVSAGNPRATSAFLRIFQRDTLGSKSRDKGALMILKDGKNDSLQAGHQDAAADYLSCHVKLIDQS